MNWQPTVWKKPGDDILRPIEIHRVPQIEGPDRYAVRRGGDCLNKSGEWEWEPSPSNRSDAFFARCRWATFEEAAKAAESAP